MPVADLAQPQPEEGNHALRLDWREVRARLPRKGTGDVDWVRALEERLIEPKAGLHGEPDQPVFPLAVERTPAAQPIFKVTFPHQAHTRWLACVNCHPAIFEMRRGAARISMAAIYAGQYCGVCHGKVSFAVPTGCPRCHLALTGRQ